MAQNITIQYGTYVIGTTSSSIREGKYRETHSYRQYTLNVDFIVTGTDDATFVTNIQAAETALEKDNQRLQILFGTETHRDFNPTNYTGLNVRTTLNKSGDNVDTDRSRLYSLTITVALPADSSDDDFRQSASWSLAFDASKRMTLSFSGVYTAGYPGSSATKAHDNYIAQINTWITSVFSILNTSYPALTIAATNFELIDESLSAQDDDYHIMRFNRTYRQIFFNETSSTTDNASIQNATVSFTRSYSNRVGDKSLSPPIRVGVSYSCNVDYTQTSTSALRALYTGTIKPWILDQARAAWNGTFVSLESGSEELQVSGNMIRANLNILIISGTGNKMSINEETTIQYNLRKTYIDLWDGKEYSFSVFSPGEDITATVRRTEEVLNGSESSYLPPSTLKPPTPRRNIKGTWDPQTRSVSYSTDFIGKEVDAGSQSTQKKLLKATITQAFKWINAPRSILGFAPVGRGTILRQEQVRF